MAQQRRNKRTAGKQASAKIAATEVELFIDSIGARADGIGRVGGEKLFVPLSAPGDYVRVSRRGDRGELESIIEPSPHRADPACVHYGSCGGCGLQHVSEKFYRDWKRNLVVDTLARESFEEDIVAPLVACAPATRRRVSFAVRKTAAGLILGFNQRASMRVVAIRQCNVLAPQLEKALPNLQNLALATPARWRSFNLSVTLCDNGLDVVFQGGDASDDLSGIEFAQLTEKARNGGMIRVFAGDAPVAMFEEPFVRFGGVRVAVPPGGFLQASADGEEALAEFVVKNSPNSKRIADLFSGCGTLSLSLAGRAAVDAFDSDAQAISALNMAARAAELRFPLKASQRNLFERPLSAEELKAYDAVVFDPPRAGAKAQVGELAQSSVQTVIGVSCNPPSFVRDAAILRDGGYHLSQVLPVDQFVYSPHVELAGLFTKG